jgi:hypothetical protein
MFHCPYFLHVFTVSNGFINRVLIVATTPSKCFFLAILYALELGEIEKILVWPLGMTNISILFLKKKILHS